MDGMEVDRPKQLKWCPVCELQVGYMGKKKLMWAGSQKN